MKQREATMTNQPNQESSPLLQQPKNSEKNQVGPVGKGCLGCLGLIVLLAIIGAIAEWIGPSVTVSGSSGQMKYKIISMSAGNAGFNLSQKIYRVAADHPKMKTLTVELEVSVLGGVVDKYGKTVNDLDEVRRYNDAIAYAVRTKEVYALQIAALNYSNLLEK